MIAASLRYVWTFYGDQRSEYGFLGLLDKGKDVPSLAAAKTVIETTHSVDRHRRGLLFVKRAHGHHRSAGLLHFGHLGDQLHEVGCLPDPIDVSSVCHRHTDHKEHQELLSRPQRQI